MKTLEIGTGTGYNAALLAETAGPGCVTTVELDEEMAGHARRALRRAGIQVTTVVGDGALGYAPRAPYDRLIATVAVRTVPYAWIEQVRPGGRIVAPLNFSFGDTGALLVLTVRDDGSAIGRFHGGLAFMLLRSQRSREWRDVNGQYESAVTRSCPHEAFGDDDDVRFAFGALLSGVRDGRTFRFEEEDGVPALCLQDEVSGSWAAFTPGAGEHVVRQHGPRRLWDELADAYEWWCAAGEPGPARFGLTVTAEGQRFWVDSPGG